MSAPDSTRYWFYPTYMTDKIRYEENFQSILDLEYYLLSDIPSEIKPDDFQVYEIALAIQQVVEGEKYDPVIKRRLLLAALVSGLFAADHVVNFQLMMDELPLPCLEGDIQRDEDTIAT
ncbi:uncharacterized protein [Ptychodera flava]|uniref:uncharacterized protein n=1 Tax=Ptychodera flava TaxID=63121 RepID=UPI003969DD39